MKESEDIKRQGSVGNTEKGDGKDNCKFFKIKGVDYYVDDNHAAIVHAILLLCDAVKEKK